MLVHISVCICSYQRPALLKRTLTALLRQDPRGRFESSVVVCDNDSAESGRAVVSEMSGCFMEPITYCDEPRRSISYARNKALENAKGDAIAFIDDDEFPEKDWLHNLHVALLEHRVSGVLGP